MSGPSTSNAPRWELYKLLAEPVRLRLLALTTVDELAVSELADLLGESQPNVSRHAATLRQAGLVVMRRQGTWTLMRAEPRASRDAVIADALATGRALCERDGTLARVADLVRARDKSTREFFARSRERSSDVQTLPAEMAAYLSAIGLLIPKRRVAVDAGTGEGRLLEVLAPLFEQVIAVDRSEQQLALCRERVAQRGFENVRVIEGEVGDASLRKAVHTRGGADLVMASRVLHHAPRPGEMIAQLATLLGEQGALIVLDYEPHDDEAMREQQADLWLGFESNELGEYARAAGLSVQGVVSVPSAWRGQGPDRHVGWHALVARRVTPEETTISDENHRARGAASQGAGKRHETKPLHHNEQQRGRS